MIKQARRSPQAIVPLVDWSQFRLHKHWIDNIRNLEHGHTEESSYKFRVATVCYLRPVEPIEVANKPHEGFTAFNIPSTFQFVAGNMLATWISRVIVGAS